MHFKIEQYFIFLNDNVILVSFDRNSCFIFSNDLAFPVILVLIETYKIY